MATTKEMIDEYIDLEVDLLLTDDNEEQLDIENKLTVVKNKIKTKTDNIDKFVVSLMSKEAMMNAEIDTLDKEIKRLKIRRDAGKRLKEFFNKNLLPTIVKEMGNNGIFETQTARYRLYKAYGKVDVDTELLPEYLNVKMEEYVDKRKARADAISADKTGKAIPGLSVEKVERVRRT